MTYGTFKKLKQKCNTLSWHYFTRYNKSEVLLPNLFKKYIDSWSSTRAYSSLKSHDMPSKCKTVVVCCLKL